MSLFASLAYLLNLLVAVRAEDFERGRRAEDLLVDGVDDGVPVSDALLVVDFDGLLLALGLALFDTTGLAAIALCLECCRTFPAA